MFEAAGLKNLQKEPIYSISVAIKPEDIIQLLSLYSSSYVAMHWLRTVTKLKNVWGGPETKASQI